MHYPSAVLNSKATDAAVVAIRACVMIDVLLIKRERKFVDN